MENTSTQYLQFNAYSIKEMIIRKLTEDTAFTDQIFEGSNLNILIDLVSYMYQCLVYNLNNAASETMFADTQIYENMNRLVKFLGYNPKGIIPSNGNFYIYNTDAKYVDKYIQKYSFIDAGIVDDNGYTVYFSTMDDIHIDSTGKDETFKFKMYNGIWKVYPTVFTATGCDYEQFDLPYIMSNSENATNIDQLVANGGIHVYVEHKTTVNNVVTSTVEQFNVVDSELFVNSDFNETTTSYAKIYTKHDNIVNVRLESDKSYSIKFGNGIIGKKLQQGDQIYVFYFASNGKYGKIDYDSYGAAKTLLHSPEYFGITQELYDKIFVNTEYSVTSKNENDPVVVYLADTTTTFKQEEDVDDIRKFAPEWFKIGQRLITTNDYVYYIKNLRKGEVVDVVCQNNYEYAASFFKWLYDLGMKNHSDTLNGKYYLNRNTVTKYNATWSDPTDMNNVYLWIKMADNASVETLKNKYVDDMQKIKCITSNIVFMDVVNVNFSITAMPKDVVAQLLKDGTYNDNNESYLEVTVDNSMIYTSAVIAEQIETIVKNTFNSSDIAIGKTLNYSDLNSKIYKIPGIQQIRTVYVPNNDVTKQVVYDGISFASWSDKFIDIGDDLVVGNSTRSIENFQYPVFYDTTLQNRIKVIKKTINTGIRLQY